MTRATAALLDGASVAQALAASLEEEHGVPVERRETHCSTVLMTARRAYKLKKPVRFDFVDQRFPAARRLACEREAELNSELAPGLVLGVRGVLRARDGRCVLGDPDDPDAVDWAVEMVRFDEQRTLAGLLAADTLDPALPRAIGRRLAEFHRGASRAPAGVDSGVAVERNLEALLPLLDDGTPGRIVLGLRRFARAFLHGSRERLSARAAAGLVVDGHGDLRAEHVLLDDSGIRFVDRLEIDELRTVDVADDLAFLLMDLERLGAAPVAASVLEGYRAGAEDDAPDDLIAFFGAHRAAVRAKVALLRDDAQREDRGARVALELLSFARRMAWRSRRPMVLLVTGPPASGKSTLAAALAAASGLALLSSDVLRKAAGAPPLGYDDASRAAVYEELGRRAASAPAVIVDATFGDHVLQRAFFDACRPRAGRPWLVIECALEADVREDRARARQPTGTGLSDAGPVEAAALAARHVAIDSSMVAGRLVLDTTDPAELLVERVETWLDQRLSSTDRP